jgi:hypothetical protein
VVEAADDSKEGFEVVFDVLIGDAENAVAEDLQIGVPVQVVGDLSLFAVDGAVQFQDEPQLVAEEVGDIGTDRGLAAEFETEKAAVSKMGPEGLLGRRGVSAELFGSEYGVSLEKAHQEIIL